MTTASSTTCDAVLAVLDSIDGEASSQLVDFVTRAPYISACYAFLEGARGSSPSVHPGERTDTGTGTGVVTADQVNGLACLLDAFAVSDRPRMRCVPLLECAGWTLDRVASLPLVRVLVLLLVPAPPSEGTLQGGGQAAGQSAPGGAGAALEAGAKSEVLLESGSGSGHPHPSLTGSLGTALAEGVERRICGGGGNAASGAPSPPPATTAAGTAAGGSVRLRPPSSPSPSVEGMGAELERLRPESLPPWVSYRLEVQPGGGREGSAAALDSSPSGRCGNGRVSPAGSSRGPSAGQPAAPPGPDDDPEAPPSSSSSAPAAAERQGGDSRSHSDPPPPSACSPQQPPPPPAGPSERYVTLVDGVPASPDTALRFGRVAVGGTFDRLHAGHELLLAVTALVAEGFVFVGVTADALLANKSHRELLQPYDIRAEAAVSYMQAVRPGLQVQAGPLSDPKAPTLAELDPHMEALVVSVETLPGAAAINAGRVARGFRPLTVITVPVIGLRGGGGGGGGRDAADASANATSSGFSNKLSSSGLRALEAAAVVLLKEELSGQGAVAVAESAADAA